MTSGSFQKTQETITLKLREYYDAVEDEGIPDRFLDLLEKLDEAEKKAETDVGEAGRE
ncbi:NepR family anti-sigma factor [uncultured Roseibium sp.]|uniref:NepR family anti-sigma factor n=1 Tax=uncultured Roseibium sp. TaxID=1936171 RepID=UPI0032170D9B